jgi:hypothetical protein
MKKSCLFKKQAGLFHLLMRCYCEIKYYIFVSTIFTHDKV